MTLIASDKQEMIEVLEEALARVKRGDVNGVPITGVALILGTAKLRAQIAYSGEIPALALASLKMLLTMLDVIYPEQISSIRRPLT